MDACTHPDRVTVCSWLSTAIEGDDADPTGRTSHEVSKVTSLRVCPDCGHEQRVSRSPRATAYEMRRTGAWTDRPELAPSSERGADLIAAERWRQMLDEGWTPEHDDEHADAELSAAAAEYLRVAHTAVRWGDSPGLDPDPMPYGRGGRWPWHAAWWKPSTDPIRNLVKAGALIAAEIDRLQRSASRPPSLVIRCDGDGRESA